MKPVQRRCQGEKPPSFSALALALADQLVELASKGVITRTMFLDEGFGLLILTLS